jgi:hypothetical protein
VVSGLVFLDAIFLFFVKKTVCLPSENALWFNCILWSICIFFTFVRYYHLLEKISEFHIFVVAFFLWSWISWINNGFLAWGFFLQTQISCSFFNSSAQKSPFSLRFQKVIIQKFPYDSRLAFFSTHITDRRWMIKLRKIFGLSKRNKSEWK